MKGSMGRSLTPWESFYKDAILFVLIIPILLFAFIRKGPHWNTKSDDMVLLSGGLLLVAVWSWIFTWWGPVWFTLAVFMGYMFIKRGMQGSKAEWTTAAWAAVLTLAFTWWCYAHLPVRDYRPYAVGRSIREQRVSKAAVNQIFMSYRNKATGKVEEFDTAKPYPWDDPNYEEVKESMRIVELEAGVPSPVQDFRLSDRDGYDLTDDVLNESSPVLLVAAYNLRKTDYSRIKAIAQLADDAQRKAGTCTASPRTAGTWWIPFGTSTSSPSSSRNAMRR